MFGVPRNSYYDESYGVGNYHCTMAQQMVKGRPRAFRVRAIISHCPYQVSQDFHLLWSQNKSHQREVYIYGSWKKYEIMPSTESYGLSGVNSNKILKTESKSLQRYFGTISDFNLPLLK